jgi:hypothetical protein
MAITTAAAKRRREAREEAFGSDSWSRTWKSARERRGFACLPRVLPILLELAHSRGLTKTKDCRSVYVELFCRDWGEGLIEIRDEGEHALRAGYLPPRGIRSWRERMAALEAGGFIETKPRSTRSIGYVLLRHPDEVIRLLRSRGQVPDALWLAYGEVCREFGMPPLEEPTGSQEGATTSFRGYRSGDDDDSPF